MPPLFEPLERHEPLLERWLGAGRRVLDAVFIRTRWLLAAWVNDWDRPESHPRCAFARM